MQQAPEVVATVSAAGLGGPGRANPQPCAAVALRLLSEAAGPEYLLNAFSLDMGAVEIAGDTQLRIALSHDKRTRSIAFLSLTAFDGEKAVFAARGVFSASR